MASRRDLIQGFQFAARRVVSAVVQRQTDPQQWPLRRLGGAGVGSLMLAVVALGGAGVYGMVFPGGKTSWQDGRSVIVDKRTGASYVYLDGKLHPVLNFTSAALLVGSTTTTPAAASSLSDVPRGVVLGIDGAPATVPTPQDLVSPPWSLCSEQVADASGSPVSRTRLVVGRSPGQGQRPGEKALLVTDTGDGTQYLVWHDLRYELADPAVDRTALRLDGQVDVQVGDAWLKSLPSGQSIAPIRLAGTGGRSTALPSARIGQLYQVAAQGQDAAYYLATADSLLPISPLQAQVQQAQVNQLVGTTPITLQPSAATAARKQPAPGAGPTQPPTTLPDFVRPQRSDTVVCAAYADGSFGPQVFVDSAIPGGGGVVTAGTSTSGITLADRIWLPPGRAALVEALPSPQAAHGPLYLVTDAGLRFAVPGDAGRFLGLSGAPTSRLPAGLVVRIPEGPALDPAAAREALQLEDQKR